MEREYGSYSDEELIVRLRDGEERITEYLMNKYKNLVRRKARSMYILGADGDDLIQEGMIGLLRRCGIMTADGMPVSLRLPICACHGRCTRRYRRPSGRSTSR